MSSPEDSPKIDFFHFRFQVRWNLSSQLKVASLSHSRRGLRQNRFSSPLCINYVSFTQSALQALAKGQNVPSIGQVTVTWLVENSVSKSEDSVSMPSHLSKRLDHDHSINDHEPIDKMEDESTATGWGGEYDDNDGMGML
jgi:hypothetical protein